MTDQTFVVEHAINARSKCKECHDDLPKGELRIGKVIPGKKKEENTTSREWFHPKCIFDNFTRVRKGTKVVTSTDDLDGFDGIEESEQDDIKKYIKKFNNRDPKVRVPAVKRKKDGDDDDEKPKKKENLKRNRR